MSIGHLPLDLYDKMGDENFNHWILEVIKKVYDDKNFIPGPEKGKDGGIDVEYVYPNKSRFIIQIKGRNTIRQSLKELRPIVLKEVRDNIKEISARNPESYLFITNIEFSGSNIEDLKKINIDCSFSVHFWHYSTLCSYVRQYPDIFSKFDPRLTEEEINQIINNDNQERAKIDRNLSKKTSEKDFLYVQNKIKNLFIDLKRQKELFFGFIYLLEPYYLDGRGETDRKILRRLLDINKETENEYIRLLKTENKINITENLVSAKDRDRAKIIIKDGIESLNIPIDKVIDLFVKNYEA